MNRTFIKYVICFDKKTSFSAINEDFFIAVIKYLQSKGLRNITTVSAIKMLKTFLRCAKKNDYSSGKPYIKIVDELKAEYMKKFDFK